MKVKDGNYVVSAADIMEICKVSKTSAYRILNEAKRAHDTLELRGRIMKEDFEEYMQSASRLRSKRRSVLKCPTTE